ncbi:MAG: PAS domain-containing protein [Alicyclobacillaceae bacterium]|nr:PAS domain-containing protein [Alicyclobacillaceae bacterium]
MDMHLPAAPGLGRAPLVRRGSQALWIESALAYLPFGVYELDPAGTVTVWTPSAERIFGWSAEEAVGQPDPTLSPDECQAFVRLTLSEGKVEGRLSQRRKKDGTVIPVVVWAHPRTDEDGRWSHVTVFTTNDFRRADVYQEMKRNQSNIERVVSAADICIFAHDIQNQKALFGTSGGEKIYGYTNEDFMRDPWLWKKVIHPDDLPYVESISLNQPPPIRSEYRIIRKDGQVRWISNTLYPQFDEQGRPVLLEGITMTSRSGRNTSSSCWKWRSKTCSQTSRTATNLNRIC